MFDPNNHDAQRDFSHAASLALVSYLVLKPAVAENQSWRIAGCLVAALGELVYGINYRKPWTLEKAACVAVSAMNVGLAACAMYNINTAQQGAQPESGLSN